MENKNLPIEYQQVQPAEAHFAGLAGQEEPELFNILLNRIYANLLKFAENVIGIRLYARIEEPLLAGLSSRVKRLASIFIEKKLYIGNNKISITWVGKLCDILFGWRKWSL